MSCRIGFFLRINDISSFVYGYSKFFQQRSLLTTNADAEHFIDRIESGQIILKILVNDTDPLTWTEFRYFREFYPLTSHTESATMMQF
jgi:hypothetical protein